MAQFRSVDCRGFASLEYNFTVAASRDTAGRAGRPNHAAEVANDSKQNEMAGCSNSPFIITPTLLRHTLYKENLVLHAEKVGNAARAYASCRSLANKTAQKRTCDGLVCSAGARRTVCALKEPSVCVLIGN